jgi:hypothetical protein
MNRYAIYLSLSWLILVAVAGPAHAQAYMQFFVRELPQEKIKMKARGFLDGTIAKVRVLLVTTTDPRDRQESRSHIAEVEILEILGDDHIEKGKKLFVRFGARAHYIRFIYPATPEMRKREYFVVIRFDRTLSSFPLDQEEYQRWQAEVAISASGMLPGQK